MKRKYICLLLALGLMLGFTGCKNTKDNSSSGVPPKPTSSESLPVSGSSSGETSDGSSQQNSSLSQESKGDKALYQTIVDSETAWLASLQLDNGAIPMTYSANGVLTVNPYFADFSALALLDRTQTYASKVKAYMEWHFNHLNSAVEDYNGVDGTIYDYNVNVSGGKVTGETVVESKGKKSYDSTDSYAATFLSVLWKYYDKTKDSAYIVSRHKDIERVVNAMFATMDNGLTLAKPDYAVKYLMDNCEVYEGMCDAQKLYEKVICPSVSSASAMEKKLKNGVKTVSDAIENQLWNEKGGYYEAGIFKNGDIAYAFSWKTFYPCATAQMFPIFSGIISPESQRAKKLYQTFCDEYEWEKFKIPDSFYWGSNVYTAAVMNDSVRVNSYMDNYKKVMKKHAYPLYNADAAKVSMAAQIMLDRYS